MPATQAPKRHQTLNYHRRSGLCRSQDRYRTLFRAGKRVPFCPLRFALKMLAGSVRCVVNFPPSSTVIAVES